MKPYVVVCYPNNPFTYGYAMTMEERHQGGTGAWYCERESYSIGIDDNNWLNKISFVMCDTETDAMAFIRQATKVNPGKAYLKCLTTDVFYTEASPLMQAKFSSNGLTPV